MYYLDKKEITLWTDCEVIVWFYNKTATNKPSRVRWLGFMDFITGSGVYVHIEHIDGKKNKLADELSRLIMDFVLQEQSQQEEAMVILAGRGECDMTRMSLAAQYMAQIEEMRSPRPIGLGTWIQMEDEAQRMLERAQQEDQRSLNKLVRIISTRRYHFQRKATRSYMYGDHLPQAIRKQQAI